MVNIALLSLLAAQAAGTAPPTGAAATPPAGAIDAAPSPASPSDDRKAMEERIRKDLGAQAQPFPSGGLNVGTPGGIPMGKLMLLPEIAVVVDGALGYTTLSEGQQLLTAEPWPQHKAWPVLQEVELAFQATVDPYVRGDVFLTFSDEGVEIEEAYLTTLALPGDALSLDDERVVTLTVPREIRALVVDGAPSPVKYRDEAYFVESALGSPASPVRPTLIDAEALREADLGKIARYAVEEAQAANPEHPLVHRLHYEKGEYDPDRMSQVVQNLIANALQHGAPRAPVVVETRSEPDAVVLEVSNQGAAIPAELLPELLLTVNAIAGGLGSTASPCARRKSLTRCSFASAAMALPGLIAIASRMRAAAAACSPAPASRSRRPPA